MGGLGKERVERERDEKERQEKGWTPSILEHLYAYVYVLHACRMTIWSSCHCVLDLQLNF